MTMAKAVALLSGTTIVGLLAATWWVTQRSSDDAFAQCRGTVVAGNASIGGPFTLVNGEGATVTENDVLTKPSLVYFGYTFCPDVCPLDNARNAEAVDLLVEQGRDVQPVFISIDPERDTPEVVKEYASYLHDDMIALTGSEEQVKAASKAYRTYYRKQEAEDEYYLVDHSTFTYLMLPEVGFVEFFKREDTAETMANRTACFMDAA